MKLNKVEQRKKEILEDAATQIDQILLSQEDPEWDDGLVIVCDDSGQMWLTYLEAFRQGWESAQADGFPKPDRAQVILFIPDHKKSKVRTRFP